MSIDPISPLVPGVSAPSLAPASSASRAGRTAGAGAAPEVDFSTLLGDAVTGLAQKLKEAEAVSISGIKGVASTQDVVQQVMDAEQTLQASIAVRDKIVAAYLEISRMAI
jgi:flagellar hook-basal body complex protein FliE